jgi:hypothetical protein
MNLVTEFQLLEAAILRDLESVERHDRAYSDLRHSSAGYGAKPALPDNRMTSNHVGIRAALALFFRRARGATADAHGRALHDDLSG